MQEYTQNYLRAGGSRALSDYYTAGYNHVIFDPAPNDTIIFAQHNLVTDGSFNEFNAILCRNVLIYFNKKLQERVHQLFYESLARFGILGLGSKESLKFTPRERAYEEIESGERLYRKIG